MQARKAAAKDAPMPAPKEPKGKKRKAEKPEPEPDIFSQVCHCVCAHLCS